MHELSIVACCKDEGPYIKEWIEYHHMVGVDKFYIYDAGSDETHLVLQPYIESGLVTYVLWPDKPAQNSSYRDCVAKYGHESKWLAFIDLDEYLVPTTANSIKEVLHEFDQERIAGLQIPWRVFGSSGHERRPDGLITENYKRSVDYSKYYSCYTKGIMRSDRIKQIDDPHFMYPKDGYSNVREDHKVVHFGSHDHQGTKPYPDSKIRLNHYFCKSREDFMRKVNRRGPDGSGRYEQEFDICNATANAVEENTIQRFVPALRKRMGLE